MSRRGGMSPREREQRRAAGKKSAATRKGKNGKAWSARMHATRYPTGYKRGGLRAVSMIKMAFERLQPILSVVPPDADVPALLADYVRTKPEAAPAGIRYVTPDKVEAVRDDKITGLLTVVRR